MTSQKILKYKHIKYTATIIDTYKWTRITMVYLQLDINSHL